MKSLKERFTELLQSDCLNSAEKMHLKKMFREFLQTREIVGRSITESDTDRSSEWVQNNIG